MNIRIITVGKLITLFLLIMCPYVVVRWMGFIVPGNDYFVAVVCLRCDEHVMNSMNPITDGYSSCMMSMSLDGNCKELLKTQFVTREGVYKLLTLATYSRPNRIGYNVQTNTSVHVSFVSYSDSNGNDDRICFNIGRELYVFFYKGTKKVSS